MFASLLILLAMPILDQSRVRGSQFRPLNRFIFWILVADFILLGYLGSQHVEQPFILVGQIATALYFAWFAILVPVTSMIENTLIDLNEENLLFNIFLLISPFSFFLMLNNVYIKKKS